MFPTGGRKPPDPVQHVRTTAEGTGVSRTSWQRRSIRSGVAAVSCVVALALAGSAATAAPPGKALQVGDPVLVTGVSPFDPSCSEDIEGQLLGSEPPHFGSETEVSLAVHPRDPDVLVATWMQDNHVSHPAARSTDGGATWQTVVVPGMSPCTGNENVAGVFDPWVSYGGDGSLYLSSISGAERKAPDAPVAVYDLFSRHVYVNVSRDDGLTWSEPRIAGGDVDNGWFLDKATVTADPARPGHAYAAWTRIQILAGLPAVGFATTVDGGESWQERELPLPAVVDNGEQGGRAAPEVVVLPDGDLLLIINELLPQPLGGAQVFLGPTRYRALRSTDAGQTWEPAGSHIAEGPIQGLALDVAQDGAVYAAWVTRDEQESGIAMARSLDGGRTWSSSTVISGDRKATVPALAVDRQGAVAVTWYQPVGDQLQPWVAVSQDGGTTWSESPLTEPFSMMDVPPTNSAGSPRPLGDYEGLVGLPHGFVSVLSVAGHLAQNGPTDLVAVRIKQSHGR